MRSQIRHNLQSFLAGGVAASVFGYYRLHQDVHQASEAVRDKLDSVGSETVSSHKALMARVAALEGEVQDVLAPKVRALAKLEPNTPQILAS